MSFIKSRVTKATFSLGTSNAIASSYTTSRDDDAMYTTSPDARFVAKRKGMYLISVVCRGGVGSTFTTSDLTCRIRVNGVDLGSSDSTGTDDNRYNSYVHENSGGPSDGRLGAGGAYMAVLNPNDYIQVFGSHNASTTMLEQVIYIAAMPGTS